MGVFPYGILQLTIGGNMMSNAILNGQDNNFSRKRPAAATYDWNVQEQIQNKKETRNVLGIAFAGMVLTVAGKVGLDKYKQAHSTADAPAHVVTTMPAISRPSVAPSRSNPDVVPQ